MCPRKGTAGPAGGGVRCRRPASARRWGASRGKVTNETFWLLDGGLHRKLLQRPGVPPEGRRLSTLGVVINHALLGRACEYSCRPEAPAPHRSSAPCRPPLASADEPGSGSDFDGRPCSSPRSRPPSGP